MRIRVIPLSSSGQLGRLSGFLRLACRSCGAPFLVEHVTVLRVDLAVLVEVGPEVGATAGNIRKKTVDYGSG